jgi:hypothetical protein
MRILLSVFICHFFTYMTLNHTSHHFTDRQTDRQTDRHSSWSVKYEKGIVGYLTITSHLDCTVSNGRMTDELENRFGMRWPWDN